MVYRNNRNSESIDVIFQRFEKYMTPDLFVFDIGCAAGSNLDFILQRGFKNLAGLDINPSIKIVMRAAYPELYKQAKLYIGPIDKVIPQIKSNFYDICHHDGICKIYPSETK
jgi:hypothetical protein